MLAAALVWIGAFREYEVEVARRYRSPGVIRSAVKPSSSKRRLITHRVPRSYARGTVMSHGTSRRCLFAVRFSTTAAGTLRASTSSSP